MVILSGPGPTYRAKGASVMTTVAPAVPTAWYWNRWYQLVLGLIAMMTISSPQYVWTLFTGPLTQKLGTTLAELQWTFSLLIILQTWCSPLQAYLVDKFGPRLLISVGALMSGGGWVLSSYVDNIWALYFTYGVICGFGTGIIYVGNHRPDGALVSRSTRSGDWPCRRGLRLWRDLHQLSDRQHDQDCGLCAHACRMGHHSGRHRHHCRAMAADFHRKAGNRLAIHPGPPPRCNRSAATHRRKC